SAPAAPVADRHQPAGDDDGSGPSAAASDEDEWVLDLLKRQGLRPTDRVLDVTCGGTPRSAALARYAGDDRYRSWQCHSSQQPIAPFDVAIVRSLFAHESMNRIAPIVAGLVRAMGPEARIYATCFDAPHPPTLDPVLQPNGGQTFADRAPYHYPFELVAGVCGALGVSASRLPGETSPGGESVLVIARP